MAEKTFGGLPLCSPRLPSIQFSILRLALNELGQICNPYSVKNAPRLIGMLQELELEYIKGLHYAEAYQTRQLYIRLVRGELAREVYASLVL